MFDVLLTGAEGFIGRPLQKRLRSEGVEVCPLSRKNGDIADSGYWSTLPKAKAIVHLAASSYVPDSWKMVPAFLEKNVIGTQHALEWCKRNNAHMVLASAYVYGIPTQLPIAESDNPLPNNPYALSKYLAEQCAMFAAKFSEVDVTILRLFNVFGLGQREEFLIPTLLKQLSGSEIKVMDLAPRRDYIYLEDVVDAFMLALKNPSGFQCLNIGSGVSHSIAEVVETIQLIAGTELPVRSTMQSRFQEIPDVRANISKAKEVLGWEPVYDLASGIREMLRETGCER